jgi:hypothetical protein
MSTGSGDTGAPDIVVARDTILFNLGAHTGNIWMTELPPPERPKTRGNRRRLGRAQHGDSSGVRGAVWLWA